MGWIFEILAGVGGIGEHHALAMHYVYGCGGVLAGQLTVRRTWTDVGRCLHGVCVCVVCVVCVCLDGYIKYEGMAV